MFTGLIREVGGVSTVERRGETLRLGVDCPITSQKSDIGDSIAVDGVCLTVAEIKGSALYFDVTAKTAGTTTLKRIERGSAVNVEPSIAAGEKFGGHFVQGHVDCTAILSKIKAPAQGVDGAIEIQYPPEDVQFFHTKSSIAVDGISLTVQETRGSVFTCVIEPHTWNATALAGKRRGDLVNIENDMLIKAVRNALSGIISGGGGLSSAKLKEWGY